MLLLITIITITTIAAITAVFVRSRHQLQQKHLDLVSNYQNQLDIHNRQLAYRQRKLDTYHFLKYNLDESLRIQKEIVL